MYKYCKKCKKIKKNLKVFKVGNKNNVGKNTHITIKKKQEPRN